ncbi:MAG: winged helix-turn-helix transcriptional regulator [Archaeoglobaceae archaeon]
MLNEIAKIIENLRLKPSDLKIYSLLLERELSVKEIANELNLSTRFVRERLKELCKREIISRRLVERGWIGYAYRAEDPKKVVSNIKKQLISEIGKIEAILGIQIS